MSLIQNFSTGDVVENRYHLDIRIHEGRWGDIYRATDRLNDRPVALRFFPTSDDGPADLDRFTAHARELSGLTAPSIAVPIDHGMEREIPYLVFRWAHGQDLQDRLAERGPLSFEQTLTVLEKILHGLGQAHQSHLTHGLIRPVKIAVDDIDSDDPFVKLVDFQIWRFYEWASGKEAFAEENLSRRIVRYTAPEVLDEHRVKPVTDLYATGLVTIEMLTGQPAFDDNHRVALIARQMSDETATLDSEHPAGTAFRDFLQQLVAKDVDQRFPTATKALSAFRERKDAFLSEPSAAAQEVAETTANKEQKEQKEQEPARDKSPTPPKEDVRKAEKKKELEAQKPPKAAPKKPAPPKRKKDEEVDPDTELFEGDAAKVRSLSDGSSLDEDSDDLFDDEADFGDFYGDEDDALSLDTSATADAEEDDEELDPSVADDIPAARPRDEIIVPNDEPETQTARSRKPPSSSDISMGTYVAIVFAMMAVMAGGVYFIAFHDDGGDESQQASETAADDVEEEEEIPDPIRIDTSPPRITVTVDSPMRQIKEGTSPLKLTEYGDDDFPLTINARRGDSEESVTLEEYTEEISIELGSN